MKLSLFKGFKCFDPAAAPPAAAPVAAPGSAPAAAPGAAGPIVPPLASASTTMTLPTPQGGQPPAFSIPDEFKDKPYLKGVDSLEKLYKMLDGAQSLLGQRPAGIPAPDAPQAEWDKFYAAAGRPAEAKAYQFEGAEKSDPKVLDAIKGAMHKAGLNPNQAKTVYAEVNTALQAIAKEKGIQSDELDKNFDALGAKMFGDKKDAVLASSKALIDKFAPENVKPYVAALSNENLIVLAGVLDGIRQTYITEDRGPGVPPAAAAMNEEQVRGEARSLMADPAFSNPFDPRHGEVKAKVDALYSRLKK